MMSKRHRHQWILGFGTNNSYPDHEDYSKHCPACGSVVYLDRQQYLAECRRRDLKPFDDGAGPRLRPRRMALTFTMFPLG